MATIRAYTTIEQSRKLAEILPIESADMLTLNNVGRSGNVDGTNHHTILKEDLNPLAEVPEILPCWSLAALLDVLPEPYQLTSNKEGKVQLILIHHLEKDYYDNPVDACVAMIENLNELKML